ncbi:transcriptional regulator, TetR family protein [Mycobacterium xenopi 4042]|uniref:Transcriptional regulator, TetR family protein n=1 Tax=Mycobacterium xenopi 4042 TaxID=1299334 RepID=X8DXY6_MYCXE|nr:transcriptional regulator, TetR family protein [Mycobacterium xenopi 4042]
MYRRWPSKRALVQAALLYALPPLPEPRADRPARENLLAVFTAHCDVLAGKTAFPGLDIIGQLVHEPELRPSSPTPSWPLVFASSNRFCEPANVTAKSIPPTSPR